MTRPTNTELSALDRLADFLRVEVESESRKSPAQWARETAAAAREFAAAYDAYYPPPTPAEWASSITEY